MSDDDIGFDPIDDALRSRLGHGGSDPGDADAALAALTPRFRRARRRHRVILATASALAIVAIVAVGSVIAVSAGSDGSSVQTPPANTGAPDRGPTTTTTAPPAPEPATTLPPAEPGATGSSTPVTTSGGGSTPAPTAAPPVPVTKTYQSTGGSVTVRVQNGELAIVSTAPASGFTEERHDTGPERVEVRFKKSGTEWRIKVELVNGQPVEEITEHGS